MATNSRATAMGAARKLLWGYDHLERLKKSIEAFNKAHPTRTTMKLKPNQSEDETVNVEWSITEYTWPDANWPLMIGDVLGCFRSALDHIISEHLRLTHQIPESADLMKFIKFPISDSPEMFRKDTKRLRDVVTPEFLAELERVQVYTFDLDDPDTFYSFGPLRDLSNLDKHRGLPVTTSYLESPDRPFHGPSGVRVRNSTFNFLPCETGTVFATGQMSGGTRELYMQMHLETTRVETIHVPGTAEPYGILDLLEAIGQDVKATVGAFFADPGEIEPSNDGACIFPHASPWQIPHP